MNAVLRDARCRLPVAVLVMAWIALGILGTAEAQSLPPLSDRAFDHLATGFPLTGAHQTARCETCHVRGVLKGTARVCAACHGSGSRLGTTRISAQHVPIGNAPCEQCHQTLAWLPARFDHAGVVAGTCSTCHNGSTSAGKPGNHVVTTQSCDACHRTGAWTPVDVRPCRGCRRHLRDLPQRQPRARQGGQPRSDHAVLRPVPSQHGVDAGDLQP